MTSKPLGFIEVNLDTWNALIEERNALKRETESIRTDAIDGWRAYEDILERNGDLVKEIVRLKAKAERYAEALRRINNHDFKKCGEAKDIAWEALEEKP